MARAVLCLTLAGSSQDSGREALRIAEGGRKARNSKGVPAEINGGNFMSRQVTRVLIFLAGAMFFIAAAALAEKTKTISIYTDSVLPSGQTLKAGKYQVAINETSKEIKFIKADKVVATSTYQVVEKPEKNSCSQARFGEKDNKPMLQEIRFGGETRSLVLVGSGT